MESLEDRTALSGALIAAEASTPTPGGGAPPPAVAPVPPAPVSETLVVLTAFSKAYLSRAGEPNYNPAFDLNHNGQIGQTDAKLLLRSLPPLSPKIPLKLSVAIAPGDRVHGHHPSNSGGVTFRMTPTVIGHTTPGALVFTGTGTVDLRIHGPVIVADARGNFAVKVRQTDGINQLNFLAVDPFGHQKLLAFPILWLGFGKYEAAHPANT
ncbi:MAG: hypothetical protein LC745_08375 [Planctomycetia bacterium]|nr:hypothetical protein [Planctomycetia bacterium]